MSDNRPPTITVDTASVSAEEAAAAEYDRLIAEYTARDLKRYRELVARITALEKQGKSAGDPAWEKAQHAITTEFPVPDKSVTTLVTTQQSSNRLTPPPKDAHGRKAE